MIICQEIDFGAVFISGYLFYVHDLVQIWIHVHRHAHGHEYERVEGVAVNHGLKPFFQCIGLHVFLTLMLGLKSTGWCGLDPWLTI